MRLLLLVVLLSFPCTALGDTIVTQSRTYPLLIDAAQRYDETVTLPRFNASPEHIDLQSLAFVVNDATVTVDRAVVTNESDQADSFYLSASAVYRIDVGIGFVSHEVLVLHFDSGLITSPPVEIGPGQSHEFDPLTLTHPRLVDLWRNPPGPVDSLFGPGTFDMDLSMHGLGFSTAALSLYYHRASQPFARRDVTDYSAAISGTLGVEVKYIPLPEPTSLALALLGAASLLMRARGEKVRQIASPEDEQYRRRG